MIFRQLFDASTSTYTYLVADPNSRQAILIDPVREQVERDLALIADLNLQLTYVLDTHVHADHITGAGALRRATGAKTIGSPNGAQCADLHLRGGDTLQVGELVVRVLSTPGHTDDSLSYVIGDRVFTGDALLIRGCGRTDFQNGDAGTLYDSITGALFSLPDNTQVFPGHDYKGHGMSTIGEERRLNPRVADKTREQFIDLMNGLNLPHPKRLNEAVPANRGCGVLAGELEAVLSRAIAVDGIRELPVESAVELQGKVRFIDVREPHEFRELHIPGAELFPLRTVVDAATNWSHEEPLLILCRSGRRSLEAAKLLQQLGFRQLLNLQGGVLRWKEAGLGVEEGFAQVG